MYILTTYLRVKVMAKGKAKEGVEGKKKYSEMTDTERVEYKKDAFMRLCKPRVDKAVKALAAVRQLASPNYISSDAQKRAVVTAIKAEYDSIAQAFSGMYKSTGGFVLPSE